jgi:hypothetical protein
MNERTLERTVTITMSCFVLHNILLHLNDDLYDDPRELRDRNHHTQPCDSRDVETNTIVRRAAVNKRMAIARTLE